jgi:hypothetical protein
MAVIIARSDRSQNEKNAAWRELIEEYPDMPAPPNAARAEFGSIHKKLAELAESNDDSNFFRNFYVDIPTPFHRGDILTYTDNPNKIFVFESVLGDDPVYRERFSRGEGGSFLEAWGFFAEEDGTLLGDHIFDHDRLVYYCGKLEGSDRILHYVSLFYQDKISLPALLNVYCRLIAEHDIEHRFRIDAHGSNIFESRLAENRVTPED